MTTPVLTVLVPIYQHERYVERCLRSLLDSTGVDLQVIAWDDGSPDDSLAVAHAVAATDNRVRVRTHPGGGNRGVSATLRAALDEAAGEFVGVCASDDAWTPDGASARIALATRTGSAVAAVASLVDLEGQPTGEHWGEPTAAGTDGVRQLLVRNAVPAPTLLARRADLVAVDAWAGAPLYEDLRLALRLAATVGIAFLDQVAAEYRVSTTGLAARAQSSGHGLRAQREAALDLERWPACPDEARAAALEVRLAWDAVLDVVEGTRRSVPRARAAMAARLLSVRGDDLAALPRSARRRLLLSPGPVGGSVRRTMLRRAGSRARGGLLAACGERP